MNISIVNEESILIRFEQDISESNHYKVKFYYQDLINHEGVLSLIPSYNSLLVYYDITQVTYKSLIDDIESINYIESSMTEEKRVIIVPVCYEKALDMEHVSKHTKLSCEEIIKRHSSRDYLVYMIGFTPGFPYLGGMDASLETPRLEVPRTRIEKGSVGIGGKQTGIYPLDTPGGWNIIGKTPLHLFDKKESKVLISMGDYIRFVPIDEKTYDLIESQINKGDYEIEVFTC